ncbi:MAG: hypothetical protein R6W82_06755 [bacterium]
MRGLPGHHRGAGLLLALLLLVPAAGARAQEAPDPGPWGAALRSLAFPGWGQRAQGRTTLGRVLTGVEAGFWGGFAGWRHYADWRAADSRRWAALHAGADLEGKDALFFRRLASYPDWVTFRAAASAAGTGDVYPDEAAWRWRWDSPGNWDRYRELRRLSRRSDALATLAVGGIVAVRLTGAALALIHGRMDAAPPASRTADRDPGGGEGIRHHRINAIPLWSFDVRTGTFAVRLAAEWY